MRYTVKLGATISLDMEKEKDIVDLVDDLKSRHKLGDYISNLLRYAMDNPDALANAGIDAEGYKLSRARERFFSEVSEEVADMVGRVNKIYEESLKMAVLVKMNKHLGLEEKTENILRAQFVLQRQINVMCQALGLDTLANDYTSNKLADVDSLADEILENIIETYDGIVGELKSVTEKERYIEYERETTENTEKTEKVENKQLEKEVEQIKIERVELETISDDEVIDFGEADMSALEQFCG